MSDTAPATLPAAPDLFSRAVAIADHVAGSIYHRILSIEANVAAWASSPAIQPIIADGVNYLTTLFDTHGIPVTALVTAEKGLMAALGAMAAADSTVQSGGNVPSPGVQATPSPAAA